MLFVGSENPVLNADPTFCLRYFSVFMCLITGWYQVLLWMSYNVKHVQSIIFLNRKILNSEKERFQELQIKDFRPFNTGAFD